MHELRPGNAHRAVRDRLVARFISPQGAGGFLELERVGIFIESMRRDALRRAVIEVVVSEQGDAKRAIGVYGSTINIAARMEEAAKAHNVACAISGDVAQALCDGEPRLVPLGNEQVKGISVEIPIFQYRVDREIGMGAADPAPARSRMPMSA